MGNSSDINLLAHNHIMKEYTFIRLQLIVYFFKKVPNLPSNVLKQLPNYRNEFSNEFNYLLKKINCQDLTFETINSMTKKALSQVESMKNSPKITYLPFEAVSKTPLSVFGPHGPDGERILVSTQKM